MEKSSNVTTVTLPKETERIFKEAVQHYRFESMAGFFRLCGFALADHYQRGDALCTPLTLLSISGNGKKKPKA